MKHLLTILIQNTLQSLTKAWQMPHAVLGAYTGYTTGTLHEYTGNQWTPSEPLVNYQWTTSELNPEAAPTTPAYPACGVCQPIHLSLFVSNRAGRFNYSTIKLKKMATTASSKGVSPDRIKNDAAFERTRENNAEFARAGKAAKFMRVVFRELTILAKDRETQSRLVKLFTRVISTDYTNGRGERKVNKGELAQMLGFNFNARAGFRDLFYRHYKINFNRASGQVTVDIPAFVPRVMIEAARGCTHYRLVLGAAAVNIDEEKYDYVSTYTPESNWDFEPAAASSLSVALPGNSPQTVLITLGIEFYQRIADKYYVLKSGDRNASTIVLVDPAPVPPGV